MPYEPSLTRDNTPARRRSLPVVGPVASTGRAGRLWARGRPVAVRLYRLAVVLAIVWLLYRHQARVRIDGDAPISVAEIKPLLPRAARLEVDTSDRRGLFVFDRDGRSVGYVLRTAPISDHITGYSGPTDTLVALGPDMRVAGVRIRSSADTNEHVSDVAADDYFLKTWNGMTWDQVAGMDPKSAGIEGTSGASLTSLCIANGIRHRFRYSQQIDARAPALHVAPRDIGLAIVLLVAIVFSFTRLRSRVWARRAFQAVLIGYVGFWNGQLISQALMAGWAGSGIPWAIAPGLVLMVAAALIVPWTSRRALYCSQICPFGASQEWMGRLNPRKKLKIPHGLDVGLRWLPVMLIALVLIVTMIHLPVDLSGIEPFDAYLVRAAGWATIGVAVAGLVAALFVPMAYCKYGCPTGQVLAFVRSHGKADGFGRREIAAAALVLLAAGLYLKYDLIHHWIVR